MNSALKHTIIAMATTALSMTAACKSDTGPEAVELTEGAEAGDQIEAAAIAEEAPAHNKAGEGAEASCGEGSCGEGSCGEK